jgi:hypothetical protein
MSAESDYLQSIIDRKVQFLTDPVFDPSRTGGRLDIGIEISIIEASLMPAAFGPDGAFHASFSPGQKSYIRASTAALVETTQGVRMTPRGPTPLRVRTGLHFPQTAIGQRWHAYDPSRPNWIDSDPWSPLTPARIRAVDISLVPFGQAPRSGIGPQSDGRVHLQVTAADGRTTLPTDLRLDRYSMQLMGNGPAMERLDHPSTWVVGFFLYLHPPD